MRSHTMPKMLLLAALLAQAFPALPEPSQTPLLNRPESKPRPNVMFTLDDSGSMTYQYLPERDFVVNNKTISFPNDGKVFLHPKELGANKFSFDGSFADSFYVTSDQGSNLTDAELLMQMQMRSPQVNGLYYDPSKRYKPWNTADGTAFNSVSTSHVWLNPMYYKPGYTIPAANQNDYVDLTTNLTADVKWYCGIDVGSPNYNNSACASVSRTFKPALVYLLKTPSASANPTSTSGYDEYDLNSSTRADYPGKLTERIADGSCSYNKDADTTHCDQGVELQNYANWFAFYRSRMFVAAGGIPDSLRAVQNSIRLGWGTIHPKHTGSANAGSWSQYQADADIGSSAPSGSVQQGVRPLSSTHLSNFTDWIRGITTLRRTPTLHAMASVGTYFTRNVNSDLYSPWQNELTAITPGNATRSTPLSCRRAYHLVVTDGYYNTDAELKGYPDDIYGAAGLSYTSIGNVDADFTSASTFPGTRNTAGSLSTAKVFADTLPDTLADYAMKLWATDLQPTADDVKPISQGGNPSTPPTTADLINEVKSDPATWQHLTHFMVGFGVTGTLTPSDDTLAALINGTQTWPTSLSRIDDLWHAAINSRGQYFAANNSAALQSSVAEALRLSSTALLKEAGLATPSSQLTDGVTAYIPEYNPVSWTGDVQARSLDAKGNYGALPLWSANLQLVSAIASGTARNAFINDQGTIRALSKSTSSYNALSASTQAAVSNNLVRYLLGSSADIDGLRPRAMRTQTYPDGTSKLTRQYLSDIIDSTPLLVTVGTDLHYNNINQDASYTEYLTDKKERTENILFVGANDGMLHAFKASTGDEIFAFVPAGAISNLSKIAQVDYGYADSSNTHRYLVDGPLVESDAQLGTNKDWTNVVVGTMGVGGRSIFALKLSRKTPQTMNASSVLWEAQGSDTTMANDTHADIGYITAPPQIGRLPDGTWKVFVGNGVDSATGNASLLLLDMDTGAVTSVVAYQHTSTGTNSAVNGMGGVVLIQDPNTNNVIGAYAGDLQGNVWRFDVTSTPNTNPGQPVTYTASQMVVARGSDSANTPLFTAPTSSSTIPGCPSTVPQSILASPVVVSNRLGGQMVVVNTGKLMTACDASDKSIQTVYGLWDQTAFGSNQATAMQTIARTQLQPQTIGLIPGLTDFLSISSNAISWSSQMGWYMDLDIPSATTDVANPRPKALFAPQRLGGSVLIGASVPSSPQESCTNDQSSTYYFFLKATSGSRALLASVDTNHDGVVDDHDNPDAAGWSQSGVNGRLLDGPTPPDPGCKNGVEIDPKTHQVVRDCGVAKDRIWRQLLNPPHP
jgi:type IV pilus assembly protein PilY1